MKKSLMLAAVMMISTVIFAQHKRMDPQERATKQSDKMKTALSLNDTQYASIKGINEKYAAKGLEIRKDSAARVKKA